MKRALILCMTVVFMLTVSCGGGRKTLSMRDEYFFRNAEGLPLGDVDNGCPYKVNYRTGAVTPVCVDPLCGHDEDSGCPFYEAEQCVPSGNTMFFIRGEMSVDQNTGERSGKVTLCAYDMLNGGTKELGAFEDSVSIIAAAEGRAYFYRLVPDDDGVSAKYHFYYADGGKIREMPMKDEYCSDDTGSYDLPVIFAVDGERIYWYVAAEDGMAFWSTDFDGKDRRELDITVPQAMNGQFSDGYSYYMVKRPSEANDAYGRLLSQNSNELWRVRTHGGEPEKLSDNIAQFIVSGGKIYYTVAEKEPETIMIHGDAYYDLCGGKIYSMNADGSGVELIAGTEYDFAYLYGTFGGALYDGENTYIALMFSGLREDDFYADGYDYNISPDTLIYDVSGNRFIRGRMPDGR